MDNILTRHYPVTIDMLMEGGMLLVDKPLHWTSFDVVNKLRYAMKRKLGFKKYKVGHAGTLDPLATGLLLICFASYTKKISLLSDLDKVYSGTFKLWETTPSMDKELATDQYFPRKHFSSEELMTCKDSFMGVSQQLPPMYSAIKKNGIPLYKLAREGKTIELKPRTIVIHEFEIECRTLPFIDFKVKSSKGTYMRSLAHDFGKCLGTGAYLYALKREAVGDYLLDDAWNLDELIEFIQNAA